MTQIIDIHQRSSTELFGYLSIVFMKTHLWSAMESISSKGGCAPETLGCCIKQKGNDQGDRDSITTDQRQADSKINHRMT